MNLELVKFSKEYIELLEKWEGTGELSKYLSHTTPRYLRDLDPESEKHTLFFLIKFSEQLIGAVWLEDITEDDAKLGIYIAETGYRGKGIGGSVIKTLLEIAFKEMDLEKVYLNVRETNVNAIKCYEKCGFKIIKEHPKKYFSDSSYQGAYQMALLKEDYI